MSLFDSAIPCRLCGEQGPYHDPALHAPCDVPCESYAPEAPDRECPACGEKVNSWWKSVQCPKHFLPSHLGGGCEGVLQSIALGERTLCP